MERRARKRLHADGSNVLGIAAQDLSDALVGLCLLLVWAGGEDDQLRFSSVVTQDHGQLFAIRRDRRIAAAARGLLPKLPFPPAVGTSNRQGVLGQLGGEAAVEA